MHFVLVLTNSSIIVHYAILWLVRVIKMCLILSFPCIDGRSEHIFFLANLNVKSPADSSVKCMIPVCSIYIVQCTVL